MGRDRHPLGRELKEASGQRSTRAKHESWQIFNQDPRLPNLAVEGHFLNKCKPEVLAHKMQIQSITMLTTHPPFERQHLKG